MKKIMTTMLGLSLVFGAATAFAQEKTTDSSKMKKTSKGKTKKTTASTKTS
jgi:hypothetical protein